MGKTGELFGDPPGTTSKGKEEADKWGERQETVTPKQE
jgi:hypothetical protein